MFTRRPLDWQVGPLKPGETTPARFVPAAVPGAVQLDWARAEGWPDLHVADRWRDYLWMEDAAWLYRAPLNPPPLGPGDRLFFVCRGIDYRFEIRHAGRTLLAQEGMFTPVELDLTGLAAPGEPLEILVHPAPKSRPAPADRVQANQSCKPAVSYGWDFHPRLVPLGIWDETYLEVRPASHLRSAELLYELSPALDAVAVRVEVALSPAAAGRLRWTLTAPDGRVATTQTAAVPGPETCLAAKLPAPVLWWPNGQGEPALYRSTVSLLDRAGRETQRLEQRVGFRRVRLVMHEGAWEYPPNRRFPKSRSHPPITLEINGRAIFAKGTNWVSPDIFPGRVSAETLRTLLALARDAHMNLLRCWGGAPVQKEAFFDLCDEFGLMVWQEFPLACNRYEGTPDYLRVLDQESRSILRRLRPHACVALWCGGNELFNVWSGMTDQDLALRLLNRNCYDLDPQRPFLPTSPVDGMGHGHYVFRTAEGEEVFQLFAPASCTAYTEFGCGGPAHAELLREIIPAADLFPPKLGTAWETHHALGAWEPNSHLLYDVIERYFGPCESLEQLVERGQLLQAEGLKCLFEEARRQKPRAAMALNWCFNEPWPCAANMSVLAWPATPKAAYHAVAGALRPVLASAKLARFQWKEGDEFNPELWLLNDSPAPLPAGRIEAFVRLGAVEHRLLAWDHPAVEPNRNLPGPVIRFALPAGPGPRMTLVLRCPDHPERDSEYVLLYQPAAAVGPDGTRRLNQ